MESKKRVANKAKFPVDLATKLAKVKELEKMKSEKKGKKFEQLNAQKIKINNLIQISKNLSFLFSSMIDHGKLQLLIQKGNSSNK